MSTNYKKGNSGALVASIVVVLVLLVLGFYSVKKRPLKPEGLEGQQQSDEILNALNAQSDSTEINDIENDALNTNLDDLNKDLDTAGGQL